MPDPYLTITTLDPSIVGQIADVLETRAADLQQQAMLESYLADVPFPPDARVLEIGCGTGAIARRLARQPNVAAVLGIDPSPVLITHARRLSDGLPLLRFEEGDGQRLSLPDAAVDVVVIHTVLCHVLAPEAVLAEAFRVLRSGGYLALFDGDYATTSVALNQHDPLEDCVTTAIANLVYDPWLVRRLPALAEQAGFTVQSFRSHGYVQIREPTYMLTLIDRGTDILARAGQIGDDLAASLKQEARRRVAAGRFYGQIAYASLIAQRPA